MPITPLIHVTAAYSNAVLTAVMPHVSDFAKKLDLPIPQPVTLSQVAYSGIGNMKGFMGCGIWMTNGYWFSFNSGAVDSFRYNRGNPFIDDNPHENWPKYAFGKSNMTTNEAIQLARDSITKLGYNVTNLYADRPPDIFNPPADLGDGNYFPFCEMYWKNDEQEGTNIDERVNINFQINMGKKTVVGMYISSRKIWQPSPVIPITPELESDFIKKHQMKMTIHTNVSPILLQH